LTQPSSGADLKLATLYAEPVSHHTSFPFILHCSSLNIEDNCLEMCGAVLAGLGRASRHSKY